MTGMWSLRIKKLIDYLGMAEGWQIHKNKTESDVTAFYGCYRKVHPDFAGWIWLDDLAKKHNLESYRHIYKKRVDLNGLISHDKNLMEIYNDLSKMFHYKNTKKLGLEMFPSFKTAKTYFSLYTNSQRGGTLSLQRALVSMGYMVSVDGVIGNQTLSAVGRVRESEALNTWMLYHMQEYYDTLVEQNPLRFKMYARGWTNRLKALV